MSEINVRALKWDTRFLDVCRLVSTWSKDPSTKTGCVIVDENRAIVSTGYNGFARGVVDHPERYSDRSTKYRYVVHCDTNAIYSAARRGVSLKGCTMYLTGPPCNECMKGIIQSGITKVVWPADNPFERDPLVQERWRESIAATYLMASEAGILLSRVE